MKNFTQFALAASFALSTAALAGCADDLGGDFAGPVVSQTIPAPISDSTPFTFERQLGIDWSTEISQIRFDSPALGATLDGIERIEVRLVGQGASRTLVDVFAASISSGSTSVTTNVAQAFYGSSLDAFGAGEDLDGDFRTNDSDNCPQIINASQDDADGDGIGAACDVDDEDATVGANHPDAGMPEVQLRFRVFADPAVIPEGGVLLETTIGGSGLIDVRL